MGGEQYNITDIIDRAKADYRTTHKVGVQSCKVYVKPEEGAAYYVINKFSGKLELQFFSQRRRQYRTAAAPAIPAIRLHKQKGLCTSTVQRLLFMPGRLRMRSAHKQRKIILNFGISERLRVFRYPIFTGGVVKAEGISNHFSKSRKPVRTPASAKGTYALRPDPGPGSRTHSARWR